MHLYYIYIHRERVYHLRYVHVHIFIYTLEGIVWDTVVGLPVPLTCRARTTFCTGNRYGEQARLNAALEVGTQSLKTCKGSLETLKDTRGQNPKPYTECCATSEPGQKREKWALPWGP